MFHSYRRIGNTMVRVSNLSDENTEMCIGNGRRMGNGMQMSYWTRVLFFAMVASLSLPLFADERDPPEPKGVVLQAQQLRIAAMAKAAQSTVGVFGMDGQGGGSGVVVTSDGYVVTNFHVSSPFGNFMRCGLNDGHMYDAVIVAIDPTGDLALLKILGRNDFVPATMANSDDVRIGQWCFAAGNPFVLATNLQPSITYGLISGVHRYQYPAGTILEYTDCLQTDAAINPGNSGGPLFNAQGDLIGINGRCSFEKRSRVNVGVGYAISINQVKQFMGQLRSGRLVDHATIGFTVATDSDNKVIVSNIIESSDAFRRGLRYGDEILSLADREIDTTNEFKNILGIYPSEWRIPLRYRNANGIVETWVRLPRLHREEELWKLIENESSQGDQAPREPKPDQDPHEPHAPQPGAPEKEGESEKESQSDSEASPALLAQFEERSGFVNYYFNRQELDRILKLQTAFQSWQQADPQHRFRGVLSGETTSVTITLQTNAQTIQIGEKQEGTKGQSDWSSMVNNQSVTCAAIGLQLWMKWHREGARQLGDTHYFGTAPLIRTKQLLDVTRVTVDELNCMIYTDPATGLIRLIEMQADTDRDPAELYFQYGELQAERIIPSRLQLFFGTEPRLSLELQGSEVLVEKLPLEEAGGNP